MKILFISLFLIISCVGDKKIRDVMEDSEGNKMELVFDNEKETLLVTYKGQEYTLKQVPMASGIRYENGDYHFSQWQGQTEFFRGSEVLFRAP